MNIEKKVWMHTFGCQMNKLDSELVLGGLRDRGYSAVESVKEADLAVINTCSVRQLAEDKAYSYLGVMAQQKRARPDMVVGVMGCMAQNEQKTIFRRCPEVDFVVGPNRIGLVPDIVDRVIADRGRIVEISREMRRYASPNRKVRPNRFQAFIEIATGCNLSCAYCIVPFVRGREISRPMEEILDEVKQLAEDGCREIQFLGQTVNAYGESLGIGVKFAELLEKTNDVEGIDRIRFVTSHPSYVNDDLVAAMRDLPKVCNYLHLPVQSGSNRVLKEMRRIYSVEQYRDIVARLREAVPDLELASDFIVGFSGETDEEFEDSMNFLKEMEFQNSFVFKYSVRPRTKAAYKLEDDVPLKVKEERNRRMLAAQQEISLRRNLAKIGKTVEVLVEGPSPRDPGKYIGRARGNEIVCFPGTPSLTGQLVDVHVDAATALTLAGEPVPVLQRNAS